MAVIVQFTRLECKTTEDNTGPDNLKLQIWLDAGAFGGTLGDKLVREAVDLTPFGIEARIKSPIVRRRKLNDGQTWHFDGSGRTRNDKVDKALIRVPLGTRLFVRLIDEDWPDPDDVLGSHELTPHNVELVSEGKVLFTRDDAHYTLWYSATEIPSVEPAEPTLVVFDKLHCVHTNDDVDADELRLTIWADGVVYEAGSGIDRAINDGIGVGAFDTRFARSANPMTYKHSLNNGETWDTDPFPLPVPVARRVVVELDELDSGVNIVGLGTDRLGKRTLTPASAEARGKLVFDANSSHYELHYHRVLTG